MRALIAYGCRIAHSKVPSTQLILQTCTHISGQRDSLHTMECPSHRCGRPPQHAEFSRLFPRALFEGPGGTMREINITIQDFNMCLSPAAQWQLQRFLEPVRFILTEYGHIANHMDPSHFTHILCAEPLWPFTVCKWLNHDLFTRTSPVGTLAV
jgi:hypothetical protein